MELALNVSWLIKEEIYGQLVITKEIIKLLVIDYKIKGDYKKIYYSNKYQYNFLLLIRSVFIKYYKFIILLMHSSTKDTKFVIWKPSLRGIEKFRYHSLNFTI